MEKGTSSYLEEKQFLKLAPLKIIDCKATVVGTVKMSQINVDHFKRAKLTVVKFYSKKYIKFNVQYCFKATFENQ